jgi:hypothetical protein
MNTDAFSSFVAKDHVFTSHVVTCPSTYTKQLIAILIITLNCYLVTTKFRLRYYLKGEFLSILSGSVFHNIKHAGHSFFSTIYPHFADSSFNMEYNVNIKDTARGFVHESIT